MNILRPVLLVSVSALLGGAMSAAAAAAVVSSDDTVTEGVPYDAAAITGYATYGSDMDGLAVTVFFADASSSSAVWAATDTDSGAASTTSWSLALTGNTFVAPWVLTNTGTSGITGFSIDAVPGDTTFDTVYYPIDSPGSASGSPFGDAETTSVSLTAAFGAYSNQLSVAGVFYGDLYTKLTVSFDAPLEQGATFSFVADTDNADETLGGITLAVPEPDTGALVLAGLGVVGWAARKRKA